MCCSRAVGSRQNSPTDIEMQAPARLTDSVLLTQQQQHSLQLQQPNVAGQFEAGLTSSSAPASAASGLTESFFTHQYMMDTAGFTATQAPPDYHQQVGLQAWPLIVS